MSSLPTRKENQEEKTPKQNRPRRQQQRLRRPQEILGDLSLQSLMEMDDQVRDYVQAVTDPLGQARGSRTLRPCILDANQSTTIPVVLTCQTILNGTAAIAANGCFIKLNPVITNNDYAITITHTTAGTYTACSLNGWQAAAVFSSITAAKTLPVRYVAAGLRIKAVSPPDETAGYILACNSNIRDFTGGGPVYNTQANLLAAMPNLAQFSVAEGITQRMTPTDDLSTFAAPQADFHTATQLRMPCAHVLGLSATTNLMVTAVMYLEVLIDPRSVPFSVSASPAHPSWQHILSAVTSPSIPTTVSADSFKDVLAALSRGYKSGKAIVKKAAGTKLGKAVWAGAQNLPNGVGTALQLASSMM